MERQESMDRIVLAYSGGLDTSVAVPWLAETYGAEVVCVTMDLGQGQGARVGARARARGRRRPRARPRRARGVRRPVHPARAPGRRDLRGQLPAGHRARPAAHREEARRDRRASRARRPSPTAARARATTRCASTCRPARSMPGVAVDRPGARVGHDARPGDRVRPRARHPGAGRRPASPYSIDVEPLGPVDRSAACSKTRGSEPPADVYTLTKDPAECPDEPAYVELAVRARACRWRSTASPMPFIDLIASVGTIAGAHGVGRIDMVENRLVGIKSREIYEAPAAVVLHLAHRELESFVSPRDLSRMKQEMAAQVRRHGLQRPLVLAGARGDRRVHRQGAGARDGRDPGAGSSRASAHVVGRTSPFALYDHGAGHLRRGRRASTTARRPASSRSSACPSRRQRASGAWPDRPANLKKAV